MTQGDVRGEQVRTLYGQMRTVLLANVINGAIVAALLWGDAPRPWLLTWLAALLLVGGARHWLARQHAQLAASAEPATWARRFVLGSLASGCLWGAAGLAFLRPDSPTSQVVVVFFIGGMCSAAAAPLAAHLPAFFAFAAPALGALALRVALLGGALHAALALVIALYGAGLALVARTNHRALARAFALRFENSALLETLSLTQRRLEEANRALEQQVAERGKALLEQSRALRDAQRLEAVGRLAGGVAHDFNNLLTVILANISELSEAGALEPRTLGALREMQEASTKGADLVRQLLSFSRHQQSSPETIDLNRTLTNMDRLLSRLLGGAASLELQLQPAPLFVHMDPTQMEQVIINLITNARDATPDGGTVTVETETVENAAPDDGSQPPARYAVLRVTDTGVGMDEATRRRIFEPFFTTKEPGKGTGLGLSTAHGIVEQGGGRIVVTSAPGEGSRFEVYLPLAARLPAPQSSASERVSSGVRSLARGGATVLLVEDDPAVRNTARRILTRAGHRVLVASSAEQALELSAGGEPIDLLITDAVMGGMSGPALAARLRAERPGMRALCISGYSEEHVRESEASDAAFLAKPFTQQTLLDKVAELLGAPTSAPPRLSLGAAGR